MSAKKRTKHYAPKCPRRCACGNPAVGMSAGSPVCARCLRIEGKLWPESRYCQVLRHAPACLHPQQVILRTKTASQQ
jgi:hypothetical protein